MATRIRLQAGMSEHTALPMNLLLDVMARLRDPASGCPWDLAQDFASIAPYTLEEAQEVAAEIAAGPDPARLQDELGDLLLQVVYHARLAEERGWFSFADVAQGIARKMIRRHPHVFQAEGMDQRADWEGIKRQERSARGETGVLAGVTESLPALSRASQLTRRAARAGFDWPDAHAVLDKLDEEIEELRRELPEANPARLRDELGDLLFVLANLARKLELEAETCLRVANDKFTRRFQRIEALLAADGLSPSDASLERMEEAWQDAKDEGL